MARSEALKKAQKKYSQSNKGKSARLRAVYRSHAKTFVENADEKDLNWIQQLINKRKSQIQMKLATLGRKFLGWLFCVIYSVETVILWSSNLFLVNNYMYWNATKGLIYQYLFNSYFPYNYIC